MIIVYVTHKNQIEADKVINHLIEKKLIACANSFSTKSSYHWQGKKVQEEEVTTFLKTQNKLWHKVEREIKGIHPYDVPCILKIPVESNKDYHDWIKKETSLEP